MEKTITLDDLRRELSVALICDTLDAEGYPRQAPRIEFRPLTVPGRMLVGRCKTTLWADMAHPDPKPYALELKAVDSCQPDDVIICAAHGSMRSGIWGELLSNAARNRGCVGVIVDGAVRDVAKMRAMNFAVFALGVCPYDSLNRQRVIDVDVPVEMGGVTFHPGELVFADEDGIVVVPRAVESAVLLRAWNKVHAENLVRDSIVAGMSATEVFAKYQIL